MLLEMLMFWYSILQMLLIQIEVLGITNTIRRLRLKFTITFTKSFLRNILQKKPHTTIIVRGLHQLLTYVCIFAQL